MSLIVVKYTNLALSIAHIRSQRSIISLPEAKSDPFSLPLIRKRWPKPLQWMTPWSRWLCEYKKLDATTSSPQDGQLRYPCNNGSSQFKHILAPNIPFALFERSVWSGTGIMKWYRLLETGWWLHPAHKEFIKSGTQIKRNSICRMPSRYIQKEVIRHQLHIV